MGHELVKGRPAFYHEHGIQVAHGPAVMMENEPVIIEVIQLGVTPVRFTTDTTIGYIDAHEGPTYEVSESELKELATPPKEVEEPALLELNGSSVPTEWSGAVKALLQKHFSL